MTKISAVIITYNEEACIERTVRSLDFCDEIVVVDSGSTDNTESICKSCNVRFLVRPFDGDGPQKRFAISMAQNDWVFVVDADEVASPALQQEVASLQKSNMQDFKGFRVPISLVFLDKMLRFGGEYKKPHLRLFNRNFGNYNTNFVHGGAHVEGKIGRLHNHLLHFSYDSIHDYLDKFNAYTTAASKALYAKNRKGARVNVLIRLPITFLKIYILKGCFLDGYPGFVWSILSSFYPVVKFIKLEELYRKSRKLAI